jgi:hypothetical protein
MNEIKKLKIKIKNEGLCHFLLIYWNVQYFKLI